MTIIVVTYMILWCASISWALRYNQKTREDFENLFDAIRAIQDISSRAYYYEHLQIDDLYRPHFLRVLTLRDPWVIYPQMYQDLLRVVA